MSEQTVWIEEIHLHRVGGTEEWHAQWNHGIVSVERTCEAAVKGAVQAALGNLQVCEGLVDRRSRVEARVAVQGHVYNVRVRFGKTMHKLYVTDENDTECTASYRRLMAQSREEQGLGGFFGAGYYPVRIYQYRDPRERYQGDFRRNTDGVGMLKPFREDLREFIRTFEPHPLSSHKDYVLFLDADGHFTVRYGDEEMAYLSETEHLLYHYWCFLHVLRFWSWLQERRNLHSVKRPILLGNFTTRLDQAVDPRPLLEAALSLSRQVIVFE